jgi:hypothetical protein
VDYSTIYSLRPRGSSPPKPTVTSVQVAKQRAPEVSTIKLRHILSLLWCLFNGLTPSRPPGSLLVESLKSTLMMGYYRILCRGLGFAVRS